MVSIHALTAVAIGLLATTAQAAKQCYGLDGKELDSSFTPCNPDADTSACCASNKTDGDICLTSGLCYAQQKPYSGFMYMNGCTDKSGIATECPHICPDATNDWNGGKPVHFWNVLQCSRGKFCCSSDETNCCDDKNNIIQPDIGILARGAAATRTVTVSSGPSGATTITPTGTSSNSNPGTSPGSDSKNNKNQCPKDNTAVVGGALGGVLGTALLAALGTVAYLLKKRSSSHKAAPTSDAQKAQELPVQNPVELQGNNYHD